MSQMHQYEIEPRRGDQRSLMILVGSSEERARLEAQTLLDNDDTVTSVGIYHTWPTPGPVRRFVVEVKNPAPAAVPVTEYGVL